MPSVAFEDAVDVLHKCQGRREADEPEHDEESVADHRHIPEVEGRLSTRQNVKGGGNRRQPTCM